MTNIETIINYSDQFSFCFTLARNDDQNRNLIEANKMFFELTGYTSEEVKGKNCNFLQGELTNNEHIENIRESFRLNNASFQDILNYKKDGQMFINRLIIVPINLSGQKYLIGLQNKMRDIQSIEELKTAKFLSYKDVVIDSGDVSHYINNPLAIFIGGAQVNSSELIQKSLKRIKDFIINIDDKNKYPPRD
jgi:PAS domain S-box-containing protein